MVLPYYQSAAGRRYTWTLWGELHGPEVPTHLGQFTDRPLQVVELGDKGCSTIRDVDRRGFRVEKPAVPPHLKSGAKHPPDPRSPVMGGCRDHCRPSRRPLCSKTCSSTSRPAPRLSNSSA